MQVEGVSKILDMPLAAACAWTGARAAILCLSGRHAMAGRRMRDAEGRCAMVERELGMRIRALREERGVTQADFAREVLVARQTVSNWECGRTLPDVESLKLIAGYFGITVDELLDADAQRIIDETADARHTLIMWIVAGVVYALEFIIEAVIDSLVSTALSFTDRQGVRLVLLVCRLLAMTWYFAWSFRAGKVRRDRDLTCALEVVAFIEGRRPGASLPDTVFYRWILPYFPFWWTTFLVIVCVSLIALFAWTRAV